LSNQLSSHIFYTNAFKKVLTVGSLKSLLFPKFCVIINVFIYIKFASHQKLDSGLWCNTRCGSCTGYRMVCTKIQIANQNTMLTVILSIQLPIVKDGSGSSSNFLAKILGTATALFLCRTQFYFLLLQITAISFRDRFWL
jgi:hypothetical protein